MHLRTIYVVLLIIILFPCGLRGEVHYPLSLEGALRALDTALESRYRLLHEKESRGDSLHNELMSPGLPYRDEIKVLSELVATYRHLNVDSVWAYSQSAIRVSRANGDTLTAMRHYISQIPVMPLRGYVHESILRIDSLLSDKDMSEDMRRHFFKNARAAYLCLTSLYSPKALNEDYFATFIAMNDSLLNRTNPDAPDYKIYLGSHYLGEKQISLASATLTDYLESVPVESDEFAEVTSILALASFMRGRNDYWLYFIALSSYSEMALGYIDGEAIRQLSAGLYRHGDLKRAYTYLFVSQENLAMSGAMVRSIHVAGVYPMIVDAYRSNVERNTRVLYILIGSLVVTALLIIFLMRNKSRDLKRLREMKENLAAANEVKETYIAEFLSLCSVYMDKIEEFNRTVSRKIAAGQIEDLYGMVKSGRFVEEQSKLFYDVFDSAFINIYPDFIQEVNRLLVDGKQFVLSDPRRLSPELRILAFMRLGLEDSAQMARFLGLSLNTVYTYRNRLKSRARNRETFETDIRNIGIVE